ncbi:MAG: hypothetical protein HYR95_01995 [Candidatus Colwellbacteria bacterium]|nr:hypothetical protein [Candidatus Colwellbacteria bacterium]
MPVTAPGSISIERKTGERYTVNWRSDNVTSCKVTEQGLEISSSCSSSVERLKSVPSGRVSDEYVYTIFGSGPGGEKSAVAIVTVLQHQCNNGKDDDSDGLIDSDDPGCPSQTDDNETDDGIPPPTPPPSPPPPVVPIGAPIINVFKPIIPGLDPVIIFFGPVEAGSASVCTIDASPKLLVVPKNTSTLTWSCDRVISGCTLHDDNPKVPDVGSVASSGSLETPAVDVATTFTLQCPGIEDKSVIIRLFTPFLKEIVPR